MQKLFKPFRIVLIFILMAAMMTYYVSALYRMQLYRARPVAENDMPRTVVKRTVSLMAARGNIYDRNGVLLASGRPSYNITVNRDSVMAITPAKRNEMIHTLVYAAIDGDVQYVDTLPITRGAPFTYVSDMTKEQRRRLDRYFEYFNVDPNISESDLLAKMRKNYKIDYTVGIAEARLIIGVRYELEMRAIIDNLPPYTFAYDVSTQFVSLVEERGLIGVNIEKKYIREYYTNYATHLLGYIGQISSEDKEKYKELGYPMDALVGKTGAEYAFESLLHGVDGEQKIYSSGDTGAVMNIDTKVEPVPGKHIYLTIDIRLQEAVEDALRLHITTVNATIEDEDKKIPGGAVVVTDVNTGEVLASASYPTYDRATLSQDFAYMQSDQTYPMLNRAAQGIYNPGSTFKMVTAFAALRDGAIGRWSQIDDVGKYTRYDSPQPTCWIYQSNGHGHGPLDVVEAIQKSCNYFFVAASDRLGNNAEEGGYALANAASEFGLGVKTGVEIPEKTGVLSSPEFVKKVLKTGWWRGDTLLTSFGQGHNQFTPLQLANYAATIANGGTRYELTMLRRIKGADFSELLYVHEPNAANVIAETEYVQILQEGMRAVTRQGGTAWSVFKDYPLRIAAKTGTVQSETSNVNNGVFVCYAPADKPEIAISVVVEKGVSGSAVTGVAKNILDYYFKAKTNVLTAADGELVP